MMTYRDLMRSTTRDFKKYYNPEISDEIRLDTNVNMLGSNPAAKKFISEWDGDINGYPNTYSDDLRDCLAELYGLERDNFIAGNGSDEVLDVIFKTFTEWKDTCAVPVPSYVLYDYFVKVNGGSITEVDLTEDFQLDVDGFLKTDAKIAIMPSPNNPTGNSFREKDLEEILSGFDGIVVVDEAYGEYSKTSMIDRIDEFDNLIVARTFSKVYAMAGLRVGYAVSNLAVADMMNCVKIPYSVNMISEGAAIAAVKDQKFIKDSVDLVNEQRPKLDAGLRSLGFRTFPSDSNFILAESPIDHDILVKSLKDRGIMIRNFGSGRRTPGCVRVSVGTEDLNNLFLKNTEEIIEEQNC